MRSATLSGVLGAINRHISSSAAAALLASMCSASSPAYGGPNPVTATASVSVSQLSPGQSAEVTVTIEIADGWHINAADPGLAFLIPTSLSFELPPGARAGNVRFPEPESRRLQVAGDQPLRLYHGTVRIGATITYTEDAPGAGQSAATLEYQACNDTICLRPVTVTLPLAVHFGALPGRAAGGLGRTATYPPAPSRSCISAGTAVYFSNDPCAVYRPFC